MIVCVCRRISSHQISHHLSCGAKTSQDIFTAQGCQPGCGGCLDTISAMLANGEQNGDCKNSPAPSYIPSLLNIMPVSAPMPASPPMMAAE